MIATTPYTTEHCVTRTTVPYGYCSLYKCTYSYTTARPGSGSGAGPGAAAVPRARGGRSALPLSLSSLSLVSSYTFYKVLSSN